MTRPIAPMRFPDLTPGMAETTVPEFRWVDPSTLLVDDTYQRDLSRRSLDLIEKIVKRWDWARFKPPVTAEGPHGLEVIDGQHTAIAAATHPDVHQIPVMVVAAPELQDRAKAFVGHNKDRIVLGAAQIHFANVAAGDEDALTIQQVCDRAGIKLLRYPPGNAVWKPGETLAIASIRGLVNRRHAAGARQVLQVIAQAQCAPVRADEIKAVDVLLNDAEYKGQVSGEDVTNAFLRLGTTAAREANVFAAAHNVPVWRALAIVLFREARRGHRRSN